MKSNTICNIQIESSQDCLNDIYLTFDIDWAHDDILADTIQLIETYKFSATWFVTHDTPLLKRLRSNMSFEVGIHPNFSFLLERNNRAGKDATEVVDQMLKIVPEAKSVRSHSLTQNSSLIELFRRRGLTHECNTFIPAISGITLKPWLSFCGLMRVPYFWEDDVHLLYESNGISQKSPLELANAGGGLMVFDFHPIHVFLNTESLDRYERTRSLHNNSKKLIKYRYEGYGTRNRLIDLLELAKKR